MPLIPRDIPQHKPTSLQKNSQWWVEERRQHVAAYYLAGHAQSWIAEKLGVTQPVISTDLAVLKGRWKERMIEDYHQRLLQELAHIDMLEQKALEAYERSCKKLPRYIPKMPDGTPLSLDQIPEGPGDPRFMERISWCIEARCKLLGLLDKEKDKQSGNVTNNFINIDWSKGYVGPPSPKDDPIERDIAAVKALGPHSMNGHPVSEPEPELIIDDEEPQDEDEPPKQSGRRR